MALPKEYNRKEFTYKRKLKNGITSFLTVMRDNFNDRAIELILFLLTKYLLLISTIIYIFIIPEFPGKMPVIYHLREDTFQRCFPLNSGYIAC